jgi:uncharacterized damage-inducible protein DinB
VFLEYLAFFRNGIIEKTLTLGDEELVTSILPSGWTPLGLVRHLTFVEMRWLEWGFEGTPTDDPWADQFGEPFVPGPNESRDELLARLQERGRHTSEIVRRHDLEERGQPGERWKDGRPATMERVLFHLLQEYARHMGHLDIYVELVTGATGELLRRP